jgi:hypothetical protein
MDPVIHDEWVGRDPGERLSEGELVLGPSPPAEAVSKTLFDRLLTG